MHRCCVKLSRSKFYRERKLLMTEKKKSNRTFIIVVVILLAIAGITVKYYFFKGPFLFAGTLEATKVDLSSRLSSVIADVKVKEGDHVTPGETLVDLSCDDVKVASTWADENYKRTLRLFKGG